MTASDCPDAGRRPRWATGRARSGERLGPLAGDREPAGRHGARGAAARGDDEADLLSRGRFRPIQKRGEGTVSLYRLPNGRLALRYRTSTARPARGSRCGLARRRTRDPRSTRDARQHVNAGGIRSTFGSYNQVLPRRVDADEIRSIIIWCPTVQIAFGPHRS